MERNDRDMDSIIAAIQKDISNAFFFLLPLAGSILYFQFRTKVDSSVAKNSLYSILSTFGLVAFIIAVYGGAYSLFYALGLFQTVGPARIVSVGLFVAFAATVYAGIERQYMQQKLIEKGTVEQTRQEMLASVEKVTKAARTEVAMFCGTMSFISRDYEQFAELSSARCRVRALCIKSNSPDVLQRYDLARSLDIRIRFYPGPDFDAGIRGRIIDPYSYEDAMAILISRQTGTTGQVTYWATLLLGKRDTLEMTLLASLFRVLWEIADENQ